MNSILLNRRQLWLEDNIEFTSADLQSKALKNKQLLTPRRAKIMTSDMRRHRGI